MTRWQEADTVVRAQVRDRLLAAIGATIVLALLGFVLVLGLRVDMTRLGQRSLALLDLRPPPPPPVPHREPPVQRLTHRAVHAPSPRALKAVATPVVAPPPIVPPPPAPPPLVAAPRAGVGAAASAGASDRPGPGRGAGGAGDGSGGGGDGGDGDEPPRLIGGRLKYGALPPALREARVEGTVAVRYYVLPNGRASGCVATRSSGNADLDAATCALIEQRFRFRPSYDADGRPVRSIVYENESWGVNRSGEDAPPR